MQCCYCKTLIYDNMHELHNLDMAFRTANDAEEQYGTINIEFRSLV